jgi:hypothetical protein
MLRTTAVSVTMIIIAAGVASSQTTPTAAKPRA